MKTKKIILFIVEGITEKTSLALILSKLIKDENIQFQIVNGDITSDFFTFTTNAKVKVCEQIKGFMGNIYRKSDIIKVIHLVDIDGAYVDEKYIKEGQVDTFKYSSECILARSIDEVVKRNEKKRGILNLLSTCNKISGIDYYMYYFSCNLEHVLHDKCNMYVEIKMEAAEEFSERFYNREYEFIKYISSKIFTVKGDFRETWEFIKQDNNSLQRYSNFHLFFNK